MSGRRPLLTTKRRLGPGGVQRAGSVAPYRAIQMTDGEPHLIRPDLGAADAGRRAGVRPLLSLVHLTDLQLADVQSPTRFEFLNRQFADPRYADIIPVQRPQEALNAHAVDAMLRTVNAAVGPVTAVPPQLAVTTGDSIDNAQWNEVQAFLALVRRRPGRHELRRRCLSGRAVAGLARRHFLEARWGGCERPGLVSRGIRVPALPGPASARDGRVHRAGPADAVAIMLWQS